MRVTLRADQQPCQNGLLEDSHVDEEVVGEADLDSGFAERHRVRSPLVVLADVSAMSVCAFDLVATISQLFAGVGFQPLGVLFETHLRDALH